MKVDEIIKKVIRTLDIYGLEEYLDKGVSEDISRSKRQEQTLISSLNTVLEELASDKIKLFYEQIFKPEKGEVKLTKFVFKPIKILRVTSQGEKIPYECLPLSVKVGDVNEVKIKYRYLPEKVCLSDEVPEGLANERLLLYGTASEYALRENRLDEATFWYGKFESVLLSFQPTCLYIKERRFV